MSSRFVTLARFDSAAEAHLALNLLEGEGIEARIGNEDANALQLGPALGGVRLLVPQEQAEKAAHLLDSMLGAYQDMELPEPAAEQWEGDPYGDTTDPAKDEWDPEDAPVDEDAEEGPNATARRAYNAAIVGFLFIPAQYYSLYLLAKLGLGGEELSDAGRRNVALALLFDLWCLLITYWTFRMVLTAMIQGGQ